MPNFLQNIISWQFLDEPAWRWVVFTGIMLLILAAWHGVLRHF
jgi:hypothetical protein